MFFNAGKSPGDVDDTDLAEVGIDGRQRTTRAAEAADPGGTSRRLTPVSLMDDEKAIDGY